MRYTPHCSFARIEATRLLWSCISLHLGRSVAHGLLFVIVILTCKQRWKRCHSVLVAEHGSQTNGTTRNL